MPKLQSAFVAFTCSLLISGAAMAAPPLEAREVTYQGRAGVWFPVTDAERLLDVVARKLPDAKGVIRTQETLIDLMRIQVRTATTTSAAKDNVITAQQELNQVILDTLKEDKTTPIWREPALWLTVGATVVGVIWAVTSRPN